MVNRAYFNAMAGAWDNLITERDYRKLGDIARSMRIGAGSVVLDVGTGTGVLLPFLLSQIGGSGHLIATDFAEQMLKVASGKLPDEKIDYLCADVAGLPLKDECIDAVVCYCSFPHFTNKQVALGELYRVCRSGGRLFIFHSTSRKMVNAIHAGVPALANDLIPEEREMRRLLAQAGFYGVKINDGQESYTCQARKVASGFRRLDYRRG